MTKDLLMQLSSECVGFTLRLVGGQWCVELPGQWHVMARDLDACLLQALQKVRGSLGVWVESLPKDGWANTQRYYVGSRIAAELVHWVEDNVWEVGLPVRRYGDFASEAEAKAWAEAQVHGA